MPSTLWTAPSYDPRNSPAAAQAAYQPHYVQPPMINGAAYKDQIAQSGQSAIAAVAGYMKQRQQDQIANSLLKQEGAPDFLQNKGATGLAAWHSSNAYDEKINGAENDAKLSKMQADAQNAWTNSGNTVGATSNPYLDEVHKANAARIMTGIDRANAPKPDEWSKGIPIARGELDPEGKFTNKYAAPEGQDNNGAANGSQVQLQMPTGKTVTMPWDAYNARKSASTFVTPQTAQPQADTPSQKAAQPEGGGADPYKQAREAIASGANPDAVKQRLAERGYDPSLL